jgi:LacI family transcriptional regulator
MQQIADHLGVSKFAVSKALSGKNGVSAETRERIYKAANQLGYFSQRSDRSQPKVQSHSSGIVVVLFPDMRYQTKESSYWAPIVDGITRELKANNLDMVAITEIVGDNALKVINPGSMDGIISLGPVSNTLLNEIGQWGIPLITVDNEAPDANADSIFINNFDAVRRLTDQLVGMGHRSFQFVGNIQYARSFYDRWLGFRTSLEEHGIRYAQDHGLLRISEESFSQTYEFDRLVAGMIQRGELPSVFVCACDKNALMLVNALESAGLNVPVDCSVTGFDNIDESFTSSPKLTTIHVPKEWMGIRSVQMLLWRSNFRATPPEKVILPAEIVIRESTSIPANRE